MRFAILAVLLQFTLTGATITTSNYSAASITGQPTVMCQAISTCNIGDNQAGVVSSITADDTSLSVDALLLTTFDLTSRVYSATSTLEGFIHKDYLFTDGVGNGVATITLSRTAIGGYGLPWVSTYSLTGGVNRTVGYQTANTQETVIVPFTYGQPLSVEFSFFSILSKYDSLYSHYGIGYSKVQTRFDISVSHVGLQQQDVVAQDVPAPAPEPSTVVLMLLGLGGFWWFHSTKTPALRVKN